MLFLSFEYDRILGRPEYMYEMVLDMQSYLTVHISSNIQIYLFDVYFFRTLFYLYIYIYL